MQEKWKLGVGRVGYLDAIPELGDFRKVNGALESETYLKKVQNAL